MNYNKESKANKIKNELIRIKKMGFIKSVSCKRNCGAVGRTLEHQLGIKENIHIPFSTE